MRTYIDEENSSVMDALKTVKRLLEIDPNTQVVISYLYSEWGRIEDTDEENIIDHQTTFVSDSVTPRFLRVMSKLAKEILAERKC